MKMLVATIGVALLLSGCNLNGGRNPVGAQARLIATPNFLVKPYVQHPGPERMSVMFEPVEAGLWVDYRKLGEQTWSRVPALPQLIPVQPAPDPVHYFERQALPVNVQTNVFKGDITGLESNTVYEYRVQTILGSSDISRFKTWPSPGDGVESGRFILISDTQGNNPDWIKSVVEEGIIAQECDGDINICVDRIAAVVLAGDVVVTGINISEWRNEFFANASALLRSIPVLPVVGNHDYTLENYLTYFDLPDNGSSRHAEEWYSIDYLNFRLLGLQSNVGGNLLYENLPIALEQLIPTLEQLRQILPGFERLHEAQEAWVKTTLADSASDDSIDYVIAQIHHPCKSELWIPGESAITCHYQSLLEELAVETGKLTGHFFGHTHGYSRGQSRDVPHLWLNAASASGAIDDWGDFEQADYDEFESTWDDFGYATVDFSTVGAPRLEIVRKTGGDDYGYRADRYQDSSIHDRLVIGGNNQPPERPQPLSPTSLSRTADVLLAASPFVDADGDQHRESHWQLRHSNGTYEAPLIDAWGNETRAQNMWFRRNLQQGVSLRHWRAPYLEPGQSYCWRVRYRDEHLSWSEYSPEACFSVSDQERSMNLLQNPGAEEGTQGWTVIEGQFESVASQDCGTNAQALEGERFFVVGGACADETARARVRQDINLREFAPIITSGRGLAVLRAGLRDFDRWDVPVARLDVLNAAGEVLRSAKPLINQSSDWKRLVSSSWLPPLATTLRVELSGLRQRGADNDAYFDDLELFLVVSDQARLTDTGPVLSPGNGMALQPKKD